MSQSWRHSIRLSDFDRTACDVLDEMRGMLKTRNFSNLKNSLEELQTMYSKMESALWAYKEALYAPESLDRLRKEEKEMKDNIKLLQIEALKLHEGKLVYPTDSPEYNAYVHGLAKGYEITKKLLEEENEKISNDKKNPVSE